MANLSSARKKKPNRRYKLSIGDEENFEPPIQSSTPSKMSKKNSKRILKDNNSLNISVINKDDRNKTINVETYCHKPILPVIEENAKYGRIAELFCSDPEDEPTETQNLTVTTTNDSDDKWTTFSDISEDQSCSNVTDLLAEIEADVDIRFKKPPRRSYPGRKRINKSLFEEKEEEEIDVQIKKKCRKHKQKKKDPQEEAFVQSMNEHFGDIESFSLAVE
ncbi:uncharacterized protein LOC132951170 [Metopolophium dirhodum]|uniref:uncharacterized protein LOC132951152 n=1 Tax=Metopolophium dirhodum TaxID=44670 RepID=UPI002990785C|nr:uncharacterized protein LOC132951152 [Metopolophium dirhodum]XP_060878878.1 uncharacterized protein LOC132951152 [Metopolophium dirhodum]XP_060878899.1 uncharacterized protein LOC132951170 [Metopolophium dirhodum]XP_060878900.1 uncharacterized protein LOC132951170 [Metopolophium dirhodum]